MSPSHMTTRSLAAVSPPPSSALGTRGTVLFAVTAAVSAASLYYCQPVLASVGRSLGVDADAAGLVVVAALMGNALAQVLVVPLVDQVERRRPNRIVLAAQLLGLLGMAAAPNLAVAAAAGAVLGVGASAAMTLLPYAVGLAGPDRRGRVTGVVMSGVLSGILLSRSVSGFLSSWAGWRTTYLVAAVLCAGAIVALRTMPRSRADSEPVSYPRLVTSLVKVVRGDRLVQRHMLLGALGFAAFNLLWTGLTLLLSGPAYGYTDAVIGLFGLLGAAGALVARNAGRWHDNGHGRRTLWIGWTAITAAWLLLLAAADGATVGLAVVVIGVILLDIGMQAQHITNQSVLLSARTTVAGRVTTAYMGSNVIAGALGSAAATQLSSSAGWPALSVTGLTCGGLALLILRASPAIASASGEGGTRPAARIAPVPIPRPRR